VYQLAEKERVIVNSHTVRVQVITTATAIAAATYRHQLRIVHDAVMVSIEGVENTVGDH
jgi:hypothetical protein